MTADDDTDVIVECPRCHRPLGRLEEWAPGDARFVGDVVEGEDTGAGSSTEPRPTNYGGVTARVIAADLGPPQRTVRVGRKIVRCESRYHRRPVSRSVTVAAANDTYWRACAAGKTRVSLFDLRADAVQR